MKWLHLPFNNLHPLSAEERGAAEEEEEEGEINDSWRFLTILLRPRPSGAAFSAALADVPVIGSLPSAGALRRQQEKEEQQQPTMGDSS